MAGLRASDAERDACVETLEAAYADGRITDSEREHRVARALAAVTRDELTGLTRDLTAVAPRPARPVIVQRAMRRNLLVVMALVVIAPLAVMTACTALIIGSSSTDGDSVTVTPVTTSATPAPTLLHTADGYQQFVQQLIDRFGSPMVIEAVLYPDYASIELPVSGSPNRTERWYYKGEFADEASSRSTRSSDVPDVDLSTVDVAAMVGHLQEAPESLGVAEVTTTYVIIGSWPSETPGYSIYTSNDYSESGYARYDVAGREESRYPFDPTD